jgi:hypothetical protein
MYELKKIGKVFTSKFVGTGPSSYKKKNLPGRGLTKVDKHWYRIPAYPIGGAMREVNVSLEPVSELSMCLYLPAVCSRGVDRPGGGGPGLPSKVRQNGEHNEYFEHQNCVLCARQILNY